MLRKLFHKVGIQDMHIATFYPFSFGRCRAILFKCKSKKSGWANSIEAYAVLKGKKYIEIGSYTGIGSFVHIWGHGGVTIGDRVLIASNTTITSLTHDYSGDNVRFGKLISKPVFIDDDSWIGANSVIMPGITIGKGAIVGAGSVVTKNVEPYTIVFGNPAKYYKNVI